MTQAVGGAAGPQQGQNKPIADGWSPSAISWALYEWARNPYVTVCGVYVFVPYVATVVIGDPVQGQVLIADVNKWAGLCVALIAPILGAAADRAGRRRTPLGLVTGLMAVAIGLLWFVQPGEGLGGWIWFPLLLMIGLMFPLTEAFHNAMLAGAASPRMIPHVSGLGLALGNAATVLILIVALLLFALPGNVDWPFVPNAPALGLDPATHEPQRIVAVMCAIWLAVFAIPLMLFTNDTERNIGWGKAIREGLAGVRGTLIKLKTMPNVRNFLIARMLYVDAKTAMIVLGGVYVAGVMGWGAIEMTIYGIFLSILAVAGGVLGGVLDAALGAKRAIQIEILSCLLGLVLMVSISPTMILFAPASDAPIWNAPFFSTLPELLMLATVGLVAVAITAAYASSRTLMTQLSPPDMVGELFGLYALAGTATAWLGPALVSAATSLTNSQQLGFGSLAILLLAGFAGLLFVSPPSHASRQTAA
jgi:UMF1 family MFS transporter